MIVVYNDYADSSFKIVDLYVQSMAYVNDCSDSWTKVNPNYVQNIAD